MLKSRYANLLIDTVDRLSGPLNHMNRLSEIGQIVRDIGGNGVNSGVIDLASRQVIWANFDMEASWLAEYGEGDFHEIDPVLYGAILGRIPRLTASVHLGHMGRHDPRVGAFQDGLMRRGYNYFSGHGHAHQGLYKVVSVASEGDPNDLFGRGTGRALRAVSAVMLEHLNGDDFEATDASAHVVPSGFQAALLGPERDFLAYSAHGLRLSEIANRLRVDLPVAQILQAQVCRKLGARDLDQAVAAAMSRGMLEL